jgi:hypothetical protein
MSDVDIRLRGPPTHFEDYVAHVSTVPYMYVSNNCSPDLSHYAEDFVALPDLSMMVAHRHHKSTEALATAIELVYVCVCVESASLRDALV